MTSILLFPLHVANLHIFVLYELPYLRLNNYTFFDFSATYPEKFNFKIHKSSAILIHCHDEIIMSPFWRTEEVNKPFQVWIMECLLHPSVLDNRFSSRTMFLNLIFSVLPTQNATKHYVANLQAKQTEQWFSNPHKCPNYIFRTGSFANVVSFYHNTLSS